MIAYVVFGTITIAAILFLAYIAWGQARHIRSLEDIQRCETPLDFLAFVNLIAPSEDEYLRSTLPRSTYRALQRERVIAAIQYVCLAAKNAAVLVRIGQAAQRSADPAVAAAGRDLAELALEVRMRAIKAILHLALRIVIPGTIRVPGMLDRYEELRRRLATIALLQQPAVAGRINSWL